MTIAQAQSQDIDEFPVGMRVLAVDDNPTCLMFLETLLRKCRYHVTTAGHATTALKLLRENRNKFDLVISDVDMPDVDGFKLLELVGLEMDLPVIMLSEYDDTKLVMKGITHGACDYLLKPVRIEELKNIWQHVFRRKEIDSTERKISDKIPGEPGVDFTGIGDSHHHGKLSRKRKDQNDNEDGKQVDNGQCHEDPSSQKKPRVVWSPKLHQKFLAAVRQLGIEKAVPKKILEIMNVEKLTRENVASHLQKYRQCLKRISCVASQQANMIAATRHSDSAFVHNGSLHGAANVQSVAASRHFTSAAYGSMFPGAVPGRLNSPAGFGMHRLSSSGMIQSGHAQTIKPIKSMPNAYSDVVSGNPSINILDEMHRPLDIDQLQYGKNFAPQNGETSSPNLDPMLYCGSYGFIDTKVDADTGNSVFGSPNNSTMSAGHLQDVQMKEVVRIQSSIRSANISSDSPTNITRSSDNPLNNVETCPAQPESSFTVSFKQPTSNDLKVNKPSSAMSMPTNPQNISAFASVFSGDLDTRIDFECRTPLIMSSMTENPDFIMRQDWDDLQQNGAIGSNFLCCPVSSSECHDDALGLFSQKSGTNLPINNDDFSSVGEMDFLDRQHDTVGIAAKKSEQDYLEEQRKPQEYLEYNKLGSLEDLVAMMMKEERGNL